MHHLVKTTILPTARRIFDALFMIIAPPYCMGCNLFLTQRAVFCEQCAAMIKPIVSYDLKVTDAVHVKVFAIGPYGDPLKYLIVSKSWSNHVASRQLGQLMWERTYIKNVPFDYVVPMPLHWRRFAWRGYNQSELMAQVLAQKKEVPVAQLLKRIRHTPFQSVGSIEKRVENVKEAFVLNISSEKRSDYAGKHLLLVDDLLTTGATIKVAVKELNKLKPASITVIVAARVI